MPGGRSAGFASHGAGLHTSQPMLHPPNRFRPGEKRALDRRDILVSLAATSRAVSVRVPVVDVGVVPVAMRKRFVSVGMRMGFARRVVRAVGMVVVLVVKMWVTVGQRLVDVHVPVALG